MDGGEESQAQDAVYDCWMFLKGNESRKRGETKVVEIWECGWHQNSGQAYWQRRCREKVNLRAILGKETVELGNIKYNGVKWKKSKMKFF